MGGKRRRCGDEDVVHVDDDTSALLQVFNVQISEDMVHHCLKRAGRICQTKEHD